MIIHASMRSDIPAFYSEWFTNRIREGYVRVRNPYDPLQVTEYSLDPEVVDLIVFCSKNPVPMLKYMDLLKSYRTYWYITITPYEADIEPGLFKTIVSKRKIIEAFLQISEIVGEEHIGWRYDPIFFNQKYTLDYHVKYFRMLADKLAGYTEKCTISFIDLYRNTQRNISPLNIQVPTEIQIEQLVTQFSEIAAQYGIYIDTCAEKIDLDKFGIKHAHCIDKDRLERIGQYTLDIDKDKNQRTECGCFASIDIGTYNTCKNGCLYCYANFSQKAVCNNFGLHDPTSPLLFGTIGDDDVIKEREVHSCRNCQMNLF